MEFIAVHSAVNHALLWWCWQTRQSINNGLFFPLFQALGESLGRGDDHYDMDIITKFLKVTDSNYSVVVSYYYRHADAFQE